MVKLIIILTTILTLLFNGIIAQDTNLTSPKTKLYNELVFSFEQKYYTNDFYNQIKTFDNNGFQKSCNYISIAFMDALTVNRKSRFPGFLGFSYLIPSNIITNDSINQRISGYTFMFSFYGQSIISKDKFKAYITSGMNWGRLKLVDEEKRKLKNVKFDPFIGLVINKRFSKFSLYTKAQYDFDIINNDWKKMLYWKKQSNKVNQFNQSGLVVSLGIKFSGNE